MKTEYIDLIELKAWISYVNGWMLFWNRLDICLFGVIACWLIFLTIWMKRINDNKDGW